jgi:hypothetical protein
MKTAVALIFEKFNLLSDKDFKSWMLNNHDELFEMEKSQHDNTAEEWWKEGAHYIESGGKCKWESFEQYYKITFKSE